jgi:hypothetical protein
MQNVKSQRLVNETLLRRLGARASVGNRRGRFDPPPNKAAH